MSVPPAPRPSVLRLVAPRPDPFRAAERVVRAYHRSSGLDPVRPSRVPARLVRASEPIPFRRFAGAPRLSMPRGESADAARVSRVPLDRTGMGRLLGDAIGLSAWKVADEARFGLRVVPSAGNLHPIETYVVASGLGRGADAGVYHYSPFDHALERLRRVDAAAWCALTGAPQAGSPRHGSPRHGSPRQGSPCIVIGLTALVWRSAWKYGERAFRLVQLDAGHTLAALAASAAIVGWRLRLVSASDAAIERLLGIDSMSGDLALAERETVVAFAVVHPAEAEPTIDLSAAFLAEAAEGEAETTASDHTTETRPTRADLAQLGPTPVSRRHRPWPRAAAVARATRCRSDAGAMPAMPELEKVTAAGHPCAVLRRRRSRGCFDAKAKLAAGDAAALLDQIPQDPAARGIATLFFVHRVDGWQPGLYGAFDEAGSLVDDLRASLRPDLAWQPFAVPAAGASTPTVPTSTVQRLAAGDARRAIRHLAGDQATAGDAAMLFVFLGALSDTFARQGPWGYRWLHWRAGAAGHALYLEAEARQLAATGLSGFYDDRLHDFLGISNGGWSALYMLAVGIRGAPDPVFLPADAHRVMRPDLSAGPDLDTVPVPPSRGGWRPVGPSGADTDR